MGKYVNINIINEQLGKQNTAKAIADLSVANAKKDALIQQLAGTVSNLNIKIAQLQGGSTNV
jgi:hypothetical protein